MLTQHARQRAQGRGVAPDFLATLLREADLDWPAGRHCRLLRVSRQRAQALNFDDRLGRYAAILSEDGAVVVTVLPVHASPRGKLYRKWN